MKCGVLVKLASLLLLALTNGFFVANLIVLIKKRKAGKAFLFFIGEVNIEAGLAPELLDYGAGVWR